MTTDAIRGALIAARDYMLQAANPDTTYGYFPGGDPRNFFPDPECCTPEEMARHKAACEEWDRGEKTEHERHHHKAETLADGRAVIASYPGAFGLGTYSIRDEEAEDVLDQVQAALAQLGDESAIAELCRADAKPSPKATCGWCRGNPIGDCAICQAKPSSPETYADIEERRSKASPPEAWRRAGEQNERTLTPREAEARSKASVDDESYTVRRFVTDHCAALGDEYEADFRHDLLRMLDEVRRAERERRPDATQCTCSTDAINMCPVCRASNRSDKAKWAKLYDETAQPLQSLLLNVGSLRDRVQAGTKDIVPEIVDWLHGLERACESVAAGGSDPREVATMRARQGVYEGIAADIKRKWSSATRRADSRLTLCILDDIEAASKLVASILRARTR